MNKKFNRIISVSLLISVLALNKIVAGDLKDNNYYSEMKTINKFSSLDDIYFRLHLSEDFRNSNSVKKIGQSVNNILNDDYYVDGIRNTEKYNTVKLMNDNNDYIDFSYYKDGDCLSVKYSHDNIRYEFLSLDNENILIDYYADDLNDNFYSIEYKNSFERSRSVYYIKDKDSFSITLDNNLGKYSLFFFDGTSNSQRINLNSYEYINLLSTMSKYNNGLNLLDFISEDNVKPYIETLAIINPNLYLKLLQYDDSKKLQLGII